MDLSMLHRRGMIVFLVVATGAFLTVYFLHDWFHDSFLSRFTIEQPIGDALGTAFAIAVAYIAQRAVSVAFYRDQMLGLNTASAEDEGKLSVFQKVSEEVSGELVQVQAFNEVVRGQLQSVIDNTEKAAFSIVERLQTIDTVVTKLDRFVAGTSDEAAQLVVESEARIAQNQAMVNKMEGYVQQRLQQAEQDQVRVAQVVSEARALESLVQLVKHVAGQTNLLALNAAIEAARAGEAGRGFAVVADEVRKLSGETENAVVKISQGIKSVTESIQLQFEDKLSSVNLDKEKQLLAHFSTQLRDLGQSYEELMRHEANVIAEVQASSSQLTSMFYEAQASVQFQDVSRQQIEQVMHALSQLDEHAGMLAERLRVYESASFTYTPIARHLDSLYSNYVMEQQRATHDNSLQRDHAQPAGGASSRVELF